MTPHHRVRFEEPITDFSKEKRSRPMFVRMVSDAQSSHPKRPGCQLARQSSLVTPRVRKNIHNDAGNDTARSSSERYLSRTVSILEVVKSDGDESDDNEH